MRTLELLAPAKDLECGIAAIDHGADAVYIGAPRFGARSAAGNSIGDIQRLCEYAHQFQAKVHVTVNTIVFDSEMEDTMRMICDLQQAGVDALLLQDMGVLRCLQTTDGFAWDGELHSSTQCDTRSAEKVKWLQSLGFQRAVLARELSIKEIAEIHTAVPDMDLEVFVHGALCVSYSGVCYASEYCFGRSANRGECAQFCRLKFDLYDAEGKEIEHQRHLLSLKDLCQIEHLEELADAGACSFKIEGRLKDVSYVKNVVAAYSQRLDEICKRHPDLYKRASKGKAAYSFEPNLRKTFNRGFTTYFLHGRQQSIASFDTPKAIGEFVGKVKEIRGNSFNVASVASFSNGDGLCYIDDERELEGFRVNRVEGNRLFPLKMPSALHPGMGLYRNKDVAFEKLLSGKTAVRKIPIRISLRAVDGGFEAQACEEVNFQKSVKVAVTIEHQIAKNPQATNICKQLAKLGNTPFECIEVEVENNASNLFIPSSLLGDIRRQLVARLSQTKTSHRKMHKVKTFEEKNIQAWQSEYARFGYLYNIANNSACSFYKAHGLINPAKAFEVDNIHLQKAKKDFLVMQCRHCIRYSLGYCLKRGGKKPYWKEPLRLQLPDGRRFRLDFVCNECQMNVYSD